MEDIELITSFFTGRLEGRELEAFRKKLDTEPEFQALARSYRPLFDGLNALRAERFRERLQQWEAELRAASREGFRPGMLTGEASVPPGERGEGRPPSEEIADYQALLEGLEGLRHEKFEEQTRAWRQEIKPEKAPTEPQLARVFRLPAFIRYGVAATILLLVALSVIWWFLPGEPDNTFAAFRQDAYLPPSTSAMARGAGISNLKDAIRNLESGQDSAALLALQAVEPSDSIYLAALYLKGHAYYRMGQYEAARLRLDSLASFPQREGYFLKGVNFENASWSSILAALAQWEQEGAPDKETLLASVRQFLETSNPEDAYHRQAQRLLELLEGE